MKTEFFEGISKQRGISCLEQESLAKPPKRMILERKPLALRLIALYGLLDKAAQRYLMLKSSNDMTMGQSFTVKVEKQGDGTFKATCKNDAQICASAKTAAGAMAKANDLINKRVMTAKGVHSRSC